MYTNFLNSSSISQIWEGSQLIDGKQEIPKYYERDPMILMKVRI